MTLTSAGGVGEPLPRAARSVTFERISGHRDGGLTACPGDALYAQLPRLRDADRSRRRQRHRPSTGARRAR